MSRRLPGLKGGRGTALAAVAVAAAIGLAAYGGAAAGAAPKPTVPQVQAQVNALQAKIDQVGQQYDQATGQLSAGRTRLAAVQRQAAREQAQFDAARMTLAQVAVGAYENSAQTSAAGLLTSADPGVILGRASLMQQLASTHQTQAAQLLASAQHLVSTQAQLQHTEDGIAALRAHLAGQKTALGKLLSGRQTLLDSLTTAQQGQVGAGGVGAGGTTTAVYTGPTDTQAEKAVAFAYQQLGKPYVWGATGPGSYDCSGLVQAAWASAGVTIPRVTYGQWAALPHVSASSLQPGDLLYYDGQGHVSMYVGDGYIIDAPRTGLTVQKIPMNTDWYAQTFEGAVRP
ncbi:MAG: C40 family peptidase [Streptosporangiaceae bacterium]